LAASSSGSRGRHFSPGIRNGPQQPGQRQTMPVSRGAPHTPLCRFERGVVGVTFHDLRATAVTRLAIAGCTEAEIATITGHSSRSVRAILDTHYLARDPALGESAIRKLETRTKSPD
jgi:integrase